MCSAVHFPMLRYTMALTFYAYCAVDYLYIIRSIFNFWNFEIFFGIIIKRNLSSFGTQISLSNSNVEV